MTGSDFIAVRRLSLKTGTVIAEPGQSCDRIPAPMGDGHSIEETLRALLASGDIAQKPSLVEAAVIHTVDHQAAPEKGGD